MKKLQETLESIKNEKLSPINKSFHYDLTTLKSHPRASFDSEHTPAETITALETVNVDSSGTGICNVTKYSTQTNSHAGSHADQPYHWMENPPFYEFFDSQYNGNVTILNLEPYLKKHSNVEITKRVLMEAGLENQVNFWTARRIIFRTYPNNPEKFEQEFPYFNREAAEFISGFDKLVMIGTDAPSVDAYSASPIIEHSHGIFWERRLAILENVNTGALPYHSKHDGVIETKLESLEGIKDSKFARISFFPRKES